MVLMPGKAGGAAPAEGTPDSGRCPLLGPPSALSGSRGAPAGLLAPRGTCPNHVPALRTGHPLRTYRYMKSHQQIHRVPHMTSETKLES